MSNENQGTVVIDKNTRLEKENLKLISESLSKGREIISLQEELSSTKQALQSESSELIKVRNKNKLLQDSINNAGKRNADLSGVNDDLEEQITELENTIETLKECLKAVL